MSCGWPLRFSISVSISPQYRLNLERGAAQKLDLQFGEVPQGLLGGREICSFSVCVCDFVRACVCV